MVTVVSNYCQLSQTQLSQTFAEKFTVTEELLQSLKKTALSGDEESIELLHNIALGYDKFGKEAEDILYHIVRTPTNETLSIIRLIKNACLKLYNLAHIATNSPLKSHDSDDLLFKKLFSPSKLMTIIGDEIPLISEKQSLSKVLLNDENNELSDGTNFWDKNRQLTTDEIACYLQKIAANANQLRDQFGGKFVLLKEANAQGIKTPDYLWRGKQWELKSISTAKAADMAIRKATKQIAKTPGGVVLQCTGSINTDELIRIVDDRAVRSVVSTGFGFDVIALEENGSLLFARRYKK